MLKKSEELLGPWFVYMVQCQDNSLYTGVCVDTERRVQEHNFCDKKAARYTRARRPVILRYQENCKNRSEACKREAAIKKLSRQQKLALFTSTPR